jgi:hypothetical protein
MTSGPNDHAEWLRWYAEHKRFDDGTPYESHKRLTEAAAEIDRLQEEAISLLFAHVCRRSDFR